MSWCLSSELGKFSIIILLWCPQLNKIVFLFLTKMVLFKMQCCFLYMVNVLCAFQIFKNILLVFRNGHSQIILFSAISIVAKNFSQNAKCINNTPKIRSTNPSIKHVSCSSSLVTVLLNVIPNMIYIGNKMYSATKM